MRVESAHPSRDGGWYHFDAPRKLRPLPARKSAKPIDVTAMMDEMAGTPIQTIQSLADDLNVHIGSLETLDVAWSDKFQAYAVPMRDGEGKDIGIHLRNRDGEKWAVKGSRNGLFIPQVDKQEIVYLPEGMSNTAALLTMGLYAIGRPSCNTGVEFLREYLQRIKVYRAVIVADNDEIKSTGKRPGIEGANKLKKELGLKSVVLIPPSPFKDVRQLLKSVGAETARAIIQCDIQNKIWSK